ncbi:MAG TPA: GAF domain-containing protein [Gaiellaceae bacterium]
MEDGGQRTLLELLTDAARELVAELGASGCAVSRAIGDVLVLVAEYTEDGRTLQLGQGYLVSDFPETQAVMSLRVPRALSTRDPDVDPAEAQVLGDLGYSSLLMLPLEVGDEVWGLVEVYGEDDRTFSGGDVAAADPILDRLRDALGSLP